MIWIEYKISSAIAFLIILGIILPSAWGVWRNWNKTISDIDKIVLASEEQSQIKITDSEKQKIDLWIKQNNLNQYGDLPGTIYADGSPI